MFTNFFGTTMIFLIVLPSIYGLTFSLASAAAYICAFVASAATVMTLRHLPFTCTGIYSVFSTSSAGSNFGHG
jgi:hypothetical protein